MVNTITQEMVQRGKIKPNRYMSPSDYCKKWIPLFYGVMPDESGYKKACITELTRVLGYTESSLFKWGIDLSNHPPQVSYTLKWVDLVNNFYWLLGFKANQF